MLVLTRKLQEQIRIGNDITITVLRVKGNTVRVGIEAPREMRVVRAELPPKQGEDACASQPAEAAMATATTSNVESGAGAAAKEERSTGEKQTPPHALGRTAPLANRLPMMVSHAF